MIRLVIAVFYLVYLRGMVLLRKLRVVLVFYCLVFYCVILVCSVSLYFIIIIIIFVTEVFERTPGEDCPLFFRFIIVLAL